MKLFLSYASEYKTVADEVALAVIGAGHDVIFDQSWLKPGDDYNTRLRDAFNEVDGMIFLVAPEAVQSGAYTLTELAFARQRWPHPFQRVLPVMVASTPLDMVPPYLKAVTLLQPQGNVPAEVANAVQRWHSSPSSTAQGAVRVAVHLACFEARPDAPAYFINVTNLFKDRDVEITHVWFEATPRVDVLRSDRVLPVRLKPYESWETWQHVQALPAAIRDNAFTLARVRLSTGAVVESIENIGVPARGFVPGGRVSSLGDS
jgi:TIR domain